MNVSSAAATRIIVLAKAPLAGFAKTRLIPALGAVGAARLAERLLRHAVGEARAAGLGAVELWAAPDTAHPVFDSLAAADQVVLQRQCDGDLGTKMNFAFESSFRRAAAAGTPCGGALLIGTDSPGVDRRYLRLAADALADHDAVFGPALDGGYTLVGLRRATPALFDAMQWSTAEVMAETRRRLRRLGLRHAELPPLADIDEAADLRHLPAGWLDRPATP